MSNCKLSTIDKVIKCTDNIKLAREPLALETFRAFPDCSEYSDAEAAEIIDSLKALAEILFHFKPYCIDNQLDVYLSQDNLSEVVGIDSNNTKTVAA
jgi:hypothetical protein